MCTPPVNDNFWIIPSMRLLIHRRYDLGGRDLGPWGRFWHCDACRSTGGFGWICLHEDLERTCHWLGVTRKYDASYESAKININYSICFKHSWLHVLPLLWCHFNRCATGFECSNNSQLKPGEFNNDGQRRDVPKGRPGAPCLRHSVRCPSAGVRGLSLFVIRDSHLVSFILIILDLLQLTLKAKKFWVKKPMFLYTLWNQNQLLPERCHFAKALTAFWIFERPRLLRHAQLQ